MNEFRVLIVDDEVDLSFLLKINVSKLLPSRIDVANSFTDAMRKINEKVYDIAIFDLSLGDGLGYDLIRPVKERSEQRTDVIMISAFNTPEDTQKALLLGASDFLSKPLNSSSLREAFNGLGYLEMG